MVRSVSLATLVAVTLGAYPVTAAMRHEPRGHRHHAGRDGHHAVRPSARRAANGLYGGYSSPVSPTITCRYADGTPYDPDIIGGPNHVGEGGPAANFGGFDPCEY